ncbi:MAG: bifunctional diaminohydroxyphosphoribosylaminopyrimidine deaminase/5-amino-6-(5-phosphoribosylamino)uracil reductase RibD [Pseudomarimonas sp.]
MAQALRLAARGDYTTRPNPQVGCVIALGAEVVGVGWHQRAGGPHAEVLALVEAGQRAHAATAYVSLEPCAHHGRTPPCVDALIAAGISRVVIAQRDPFAQVDGRGIEALRAAGISVDFGLMQAAARAQIRGFLSRIERGRPWLRIKLASSLDGRTALASGESKWITGAAARADVQHWRARSDAILTGAGTLRRDNPALTARVQAPVQPPLRVVLAGIAELPLDAQVFSDAAAPTLLVCHGKSAPALPSHVERLSMPIVADGVDLPMLLRALAERGIGEVQVEAGAILCGALLRAGLVDELLLYQAPLLLGDRGFPLFASLATLSMADRFGFCLVDSRMVGDDQRLLLRPTSAVAFP